MTMRLETRDHELCEQLRQALAGLQASRVPPPAASKQNETQSLVPDPAAIGVPPADIEGDIARIRAELRQDDCGDWHARSLTAARLIT